MGMDRPLQIDDPNKRVTATKYRDDVEALLEPSFVHQLRLAHAEGLLFVILKRAGWRGGRCPCGCEETRFSDQPDPRPIPLTLQENAPNQLV